LLLIFPLIPFLVCSPNEILKGNEKVILPLMWQFIRYFSDEHEKGGRGEKGERERIQEIFQWARLHVSKFGIEIDDLSTSFEVICHLLLFLFFSTCFFFLALLSHLSRLLFVFNSQFDRMEERLLH
jgi:hypothetical protein